MDTLRWVVLCISAHRMRIPDARAPDRVRGAGWRRAVGDLACVHSTVSRRTVWLWAESVVYTRTGARSESVPVCLCVVVLQQ